MFWPIGERLEQEVQRSIQSTAVACCETQPAAGAGEVAIQIDAGYIKSTSKN